MADLLSNFMIGQPETKGATIQSRYRFTPDFVGFSGHFPGYPILPAFVQLLMGLDAASRLQGAKQSLTAIENAKFRVEIRPDQEITVTCTERLIGSEPHYDVRISLEAHLASSFSLATRNLGLE